MSADGSTTYIRATIELMESLLTAERQQALDTVADLAVSRIVDGRVLYAFGASHAGLLVQDQFYRAGGLVPIQPLLPRELMLDERPVTRTTAIEQTPGHAASILAESRLGEGDLLIVVSVSGRNAVPVELCLGAQKRGALVVAVTNVSYSRQVRGRGVPRLFEVADHVLDMPGVVGDAIVGLGPGLPAVGPTSSAIGAALLHALAVEIAVRLTHLGHRPPVFASANLDDSHSWNAVQQTLYRDRLTYL